MGIKSKRVAFQFDERNLRTLEEMQIDGPEAWEILPGRLPVRPLPASPLLELMTRLDTSRWQWKLTGTLIGGEQAHFARV